MPRWHYPCHPSTRGVAARATRGGAWATCNVKTQKNNVRGNPHLVAYYARVAAHKYVVAPRGNGIDTHRLWEALYLGCVPVVARSSLDSIYAELPVLIVKDWKDVTATFLEDKWPEFVERLAKFQPSLHRNHWWAHIEAVRSRELARLGLDANGTRARCWAGR